MSKITDTERIATALLGWTKDDSKNPSPEYCTDYVREGGRARFIHHNNTDLFSRLPDLTTRDGCAEFERALVEKRRFASYINKLDEIAGSAGFGEVIEELGSAVQRMALVPYMAAYVGIRATPAQRVAACIATLDEAGL